MLNGILATLLLFLACTPVVTEDSNTTVSLSADAMSIPGGYVVPEGSNVTFICSSSLLGGVTWTLDLKVPGATAKFQASAGLARSIPQVSSPDTTPSANPATITIHNVAPENNQSTVECIATVMGAEESSARVIVEGSPNCPTINTTVNSTSLTVSIQKTQSRWLPEWYSVQVLAYNESMGTIVYNSTLQGSASFHVTPFEPGAVYNITVIPCNMAGCNESCDIHSVQTEFEAGSPNCPTINTTVNSTSLTVSIQKTQSTLLPEWYSVQVLAYNESIGIIVYNSTLIGPGSFDVSPLEPDTVYNISAIPCNMAGCNKSCDIHSVQTESETAGTTGPRNDCSHAKSIQPLLIFGVAIFLTFV